jgi:hypothetical protein
MKRIRELPAAVLFPDPFAIFNSLFLLPVDTPKKCTSSGVGKQLQRMEQNAAKAGRFWGPLVPD